jgi:acyl-CoA thioesterase
VNREKTSTVPDHRGSLRQRQDRPTATEVPFVISDLDAALAVNVAPDGTWLGFADPHYESLNGMFGGWTAAITLHAVLCAAHDEARPSALTINFIGKVDPGAEVAIRAHRIGGGRSIGHWRAEVVAPTEGRALAQALVVLAARRSSDGHTEPTMPKVPPPDSVPDGRPPPGPMGERTVQRPIYGFPPFNRGGTKSLSWVRENTGRRVDHLQLAYLADAYPPRCFYWSDNFRPNATLTLSVYFHATDEEVAAIGDDYVLNEAIGTRGAHSTSGQQARLWSRQGALLATTEQLVWFR